MDVHVHGRVPAKVMNICMFYVCMCVCVWQGSMWAVCEAGSQLCLLVCVGVCMCKCMCMCMHACVYLCLSVCVGVYVCGCVCA